MTLRIRIALASAAAVLGAVLVVAVVAYGSTQRQLARDLDAGLLVTAQQIADAGPGDLLEELEELDEGDEGRGRGTGRVRERVLDRLRGAGPRDRQEDRLLRPVGGGVVQLVGAGGASVAFGGVDLPVDETTERLADPDARGDSGTGAHVRAARVEGQDLRIVALALDGEGVVQVAAPIDRDAPALDVLRRQLFLAGVLGALLAGVLGLLVADRAVRPVRRLTDAARDVRRTGDLTTRIDEGDDDELGRLAGAFNAMLGSLEASRIAQQRLVADASHELRTPVTSLRTNLEVLRDSEQLLAPDDRRALLRDVTVQLEELGRLVDGLVEVARGDQPAQEPTEVVLGDLVEGVVERVAVFSPDVEVTVDRDDAVVAVERDRLERAVANLVDNAFKHGGGTPVDVRVRAGAVVVRDHGPGIPAGDLDRVFERFYRSPEARALPGSGLGLSIVGQVARAHGGDVTAVNHPQGGAVLTLTLPTVRPTADS